MLIGVLEVGASALLLWPRTAAYGAILIVLVMLGGMGTHILVEGRPRQVTERTRTTGVFVYRALWTMVTPHRTVAGLIDRARDPNVPDR
jgi:hypothetical protein